MLTNCNVHLSFETLRGTPVFTGIIITFITNKWVIKSLKAVKYVLFVSQNGLFWLRMFLFSPTNPVLSTYIFDALRFQENLVMWRSGVTYHNGAPTGLRLLSTKSNKQTNEFVYKQISNNYGGPFASRWFHKEPWAGKRNNPAGIGSAEPVVIG